MIGKHKVVFGHTVTLKVTFRHKYSLIEHIVLFIVPALIIIRAMPMLFIHVMHNIHVIAHYIAIHYLSSYRDVTPPVGQQQHHISMFIILRRAGSKVIRLVVLVEALHVAHHQMLLEACHV